jgi:hypothetical protein
MRCGANSDWNTGVVELMKPMPMPDTMRPTMSCAREYEEAWRMAPMIMVTEPMAMDLRRPMPSLTMEDVTDPTNAPTTDSQS